MSLFVHIPLPLSQPQSLSLQATNAECEQIAKQLHIPKVFFVGAEVELQQKQRHLACRARLRAEVQERCVFSNAPMPIIIDEPLDLQLRWNVDEDDLDPEDDLIALDGGGNVDLGALLIEYVSLSLPDYPRLPKSTLPEEYKAESTEATHNTTLPFAGLGDMLAEKASSDSKSD